MSLHQSISHDGTMYNSGSMGSMAGTMQGFGTPIGSAAATALAFGITKEQTFNWAVLATFVPGEQILGDEDVSKLKGDTHLMYRGLAFVTYLKYMSNANKRKFNSQDLISTSLTAILPLTTNGDYVRLDHRSRPQVEGSCEAIEHLDFVMVGAPVRSIQCMESEMVLLLEDSRKRTLIWEVPTRPGTYRGPMKLLDTKCESCATIPREHHMDIVFSRNGAIFCFPLGINKCRRAVNPTPHGCYISFVHYDKFDSKIYAVDKSDLKLIFRYDSRLECQKVIKMKVPNNREFKPAEVTTLDNVLLVTSSKFTVCAVVDKKRYHVLQLLDLHSEEIVKDEPMTKLIGKGIAIDADLGILFIGCVSNINQTNINVLYLDEEIGQLVDLATIMSPCQPKSMAFYRQQGLLVIIDELDSRILHFLYLNYDLFKASLEEQKSHDRVIRLNLTGYEGRVVDGADRDCVLASCVIRSQQFFPHRVFPVVLDN